MKKIFILGIILLFTMSCKAQTIVPVEKFIDYKRAGDGVPDNTYLKDVNNLLNKYVGTWKGNYQGKNYTLYITKITNTIDKVTFDELRIHYLITSSNNSTLEDTRNVPDNNTYVIKGNYFSKDLAVYALNFTGKNSLCGNAGTVFIRTKNAANTIISLGFEPNKIMISEETCPGFKLAELTFPRNNSIMLTKQ
ncbi:hypothetical protein D0809_00380 [Flavobacterium circumlabens]|uniref:DUF6705 domain-containing protein n=1 Tax=Flavobacterium circumlabens TaxID=2133765 RepID=A0A4Y7UGB7_9FLAO|nr:DUF6705 family protein [Flavobacterium circumlabens]TCN52540.1 hypothetical protein EV142_11078 [Flavobacterium circumlabens]TEB45503.1 hypothetical protein D0809_00380 [Flavobacterium circumlabens]